MRTMLLAAMTSALLLSDYARADDLAAAAKRMLICAQREIEKGDYRVSDPGDTAAAAESAGSLMLACPGASMAFLHACEAGGRSEYDCRGDAILLILPLVTQ
jgi:hypothetical protein